MEKSYTLHPISKLYPYHRQYHYGILRLEGFWSSGHNRYDQLADPTPYGGNETYLYGKTINTIIYFSYFYKS